MSRPHGRLSTPVSFNCKAEPAGGRTRRMTFGPRSARLVRFVPRRVARCFRRHSYHAALMLQPSPISVRARSLGAKPSPSVTSPAKPLVL